MKPLSKYCLLMLLGTLAFGSCRKDALQEPNERPLEEGKTVTLSLSAEVGFEEESADEGDLKGLDFKIQEVGTKRIPRPQFNDGDGVEVVTVIKSSTGETYAQKMQWQYVSATRSLRLLRGYTGNAITIPNFNNSGGKKWYIAGLLAPESTLSGTHNTQVSFSGTHVLKEMTMINTAELNVPYWTGWMELLIESFPPNSLDGSGSYSNAKVQTAGATFRPLGTLIKYQLGNRLTAGSYTFSPTGFTVGSNAFSDKGTFNFATSIVPITNPQNANPRWEATQAPMVYSFASGHAPSTITHNGTSSKVYYAWVMPYETQPATVHTRVMLKGTSSKYTAHPERDFTKTYYTDYTTMGKASGGKLQHGKIQLLSANATQRVIVPIEYVTEYNLAGGGLITSLTLSHVRHNHKPEGIKGGLRFSNILSDGSTPNPDPHQNDQSGYYRWYELMGITDPTYNPSGKNLQGSDVMLIDTDGVSRKLVDKYFVPEIDHLWGVFPSYSSIEWVSSSPVTPLEYLQLGYNQQEYYHSQSEYSQGFTDPLGSSDNTNNAVFYAIRFKATSDTSPQTQSSWFYNLSTSSYESRTYQPLMDNSLRCAYRYTRVGGRTAWDSSNNKLTNQVKIDVVYLGDAEVDLIDISKQSWWDDSAQRTAKGLGPVLSRTFPVTGYVFTRFAYTEWMIYRGYQGPYWSASANSGSNSWFVYVSDWGVYGYKMIIQYLGHAVRLFRRDPDAQ